MPAARARRWIIAQALAWGRGVRVSSLVPRSDRPEQRALRILGKAGPVDVGVQVLLEIVVAGHDMLLAALLM